MNCFLHFAFCLIRYFKHSFAALTGVCCSVSVLFREKRKTSVAPAWSLSPLDSSQIGHFSSQKLHRPADTNSSTLLCNSHFRQWPTEIQRTTLHLALTQTLGMRAVGSEAVQRWCEEEELSSKAALSSLHSQTLFCWKWYRSLIIDVYQNGPEEISWFHLRRCQQPKSPVL